MYQFGEQDLVYNVNVCILQNISERIPWILKDTLSRQFNLSNILTPYKTL